MAVKKSRAVISIIFSTNRILLKKNFLSSLLTFRILKELDKTSLLEKYTYKKIMSVLKRAKKIRTPKSDWELINMNPSQLEMLKALGILPKDSERPKRKPGRPRKNSL